MLQLGLSTNFKYADEPLAKRYVGYRSFCGPVGVCASSAHQQRPEMPHTTGGSSAAKLTIVFFNSY
jgi:hypothetical protein